MRRVGDPGSAQFGRRIAQMRKGWGNPMNAEGDTGARAAAALVARQAQVREALANALPASALLYRREDTAAYECDGLTAYRQAPLLVALPESEDQAASVLRICHELRVPVVARGAGTGLSGGALPLRGGVTLSLARLNRILRLD